MYRAFLAALSLLPLAVSAKPLTILELGDSITYGGSDVAQPDGGYRVDLYNSLTAQGFQIQTDGIWEDGTTPSINSIGQGLQAGFPGFSSGDIFNNLDGNTSTGQSGFSTYGGYWMTGGHGTGRSALTPDVVMLIDGANDLNNVSTTETYDYAILTWFATNLPKTEVIIGSTPPSYGYGTALSDASVATTAWLESYVPANFPQDRVIDIPSAFLLPGGAVNPLLMPYQSVHPYDAGYQVISNLFDAAIVSSVPEPASIALLAVGLLGMRRRPTSPQPR